MRVTGAGGTLRVAYQPAASVRSWSLISQPVLPVHRVRVSLVLRDVNEFWIAQEPLTLSLCLTDGVEWEWSPVTLQRDDDGYHVVVNSKPKIHKRVQEAVWDRSFR